MHERVDETGVERRPDIVISRGLPIRSLRLGLSGKADVVEFHPCERAEGIEVAVVMPANNGPSPARAECRNELTVFIRAPGGLKVRSSGAGP